MVTEIADITVLPGSVTEFPAAFERGLVHLSASAGFRSARLTRSVESPQRFVLLVEWESLEAHTQGFRSSPAFTAWRGEVGPHFDGAPVVEHLQDVRGVSTEG